MGVDAHELDELIAVLDLAAEGAPRAVRQVVSKGALNIKGGWRKRWSGLKHAPSVGRAVSYDVTATADGASAEIGPDKNRPQGPLGNLLEFGSIHNAPIPGGLPALVVEEPRFVDALSAVGEQLLTEGRADG